MGMHALPPLCVTFNGYGCHSKAMSLAHYATICPTLLLPGTGWTPGSLCTRAQGLH